MSSALRLSLSQAYSLRWLDIRYNLNGTTADPRALFVPQFQLMNVDSTQPESYGAWAAGSWENVFPVGGPYAGRFTVGPGQPPALNPGVAGTYRVYGRLYQFVGETPTWPIGLIMLTAP